MFNVEKFPTDIDIFPHRYNVEKFVTCDEEKGVLVLHQFSRGKYCPNLSPFALKLEAFLRLSRIPYIVSTLREMSMMDG